MRSRGGVLAVCLAAVIPLMAANWQLALPGYRYEFPRDHFNHPQYQTEWWYYTGNLQAPGGHHYGFELTFFRAGTRLPDREGVSASPGTWDSDPVYLAHLALSDLDAQQFYHTERINRAGPGLAGAALESGRIWNGNWQVRWTSLNSGSQQLQAVCEHFTLELSLVSEKPFVINGQNGVSQKGPNPGDASHYVSFTRLRASGTLKLAGQTQDVKGLAWMDHEFFTSRADNDVAGWDWFAIQLDGSQELMLYRLRSKTGAANGFSSGTYVRADGQTRFLSQSDFSLQPSGEWQSPTSKVTYPLAWNISVPSLNLTLKQHTALPSQELFSRSRLTPNYWEGAVTYEGTLAGKPVTGVGYLEMTGYDQQVFLAPR